MAPIKSVREAKLIELLEHGTVSVRTEGTLRIVEVSFSAAHGGEGNELFMLLAELAEEG